MNRLEEEFGEEYDRKWAEEQARTQVRARRNLGQKRSLMNPIFRLGSPAWILKT
ncbi:MAG TPA: hypothetical protein VJK50_02625 [Patescibacteria group bacterium]|nr:hypothetical protein [Patescibacteria group bacterium]